LTSQTFLTILRWLLEEEGEKREIVERERERWSGEGKRREF